MEIIARSLGMMAANCFIVRSATHAAVIDPGGNPEIILPFIEGRELVYVINTHGHYDHIAANNDLKARFDTKLAVSRLDYAMLLNPQLNLSVMVDAPFISIAPDILLEDGDRLPFGNTHFEVIHTPGHTRGSICLTIDGRLFSGDTLFYHSVGRTDFPGGSMEELRHSILNRLYVLPDETKVYPGHGEATTIGEEKLFNDFVQAAESTR
jgi:hydroxyacylglutathione hydrolase